MLVTSDTLGMPNSLGNVSLSQTLLAIMLTDGVKYPSRLLMKMPQTTLSKNTNIFMCKYLLVSFTPTITAVPGLAELVLAHNQVVEVL